MLKLVNQGLVEIIGPIRQKILSGIRDRSKFDVVRDRMRAFPDLEVGTGDYEEAAAYYDRCRPKGIQGSFTDFVICAVAIRYELEVFTDDKDFLGYKTVLPIRLYRFEEWGQRSFRDSLAVQQGSHNRTSKRSSRG
ncbi:MAG TPA: PIN domain-containing protein, partial [Opitutaceae bacterium]|nr:PIN domain-containing protein [Opitutaceae bacterium]